MKISSEGVVSLDSNPDFEIVTSFISAENMRLKQLEREGNALNTSYTCRLYRLSEACGMAILCSNEQPSLKLIDPEVPIVLEAATWYLGLKRNILEKRRAANKIIQFLGANQ